MPLYIYGYNNKTIIKCAFKALFDCSEMRILVCYKVKYLYGGRTLPCALFAHFHQLSVFSKRLALKVFSLRSNTKDIWAPANVRVRIAALCSIVYGAAIYIRYSVCNSRAPPEHYTPLETTLRKAVLPKTHSKLQVFLTFLITAVCPCTALFCLMSWPYTGSSGNEWIDHALDLSRTGHATLSESGGFGGEDIEQADQYRDEASESASEGNESVREENETDDASESGDRFILCLVSFSK